MGVRGAWQELQAGFAGGAHRPTHHDALTRAQRRRNTYPGRHEARRTIRRMSAAAAIPTRPSLSALRPALQSIRCV